MFKCYYFYHVWANACQKWPFFESRRIGPAALLRFFFQWLRSKNVITCNSSAYCFNIAEKRYLKILGDHRCTCQRHLKITEISSNWHWLWHCKKASNLRNKHFWGHINFWCERGHKRLWNGKFHYFCDTCLTRSLSIPLYSKECSN